MSNLQDHTDELEDLFAEDCDYDAINENFEEKVWEDLDEALHNAAFAQTFQEKLFKALIDNHAESVHFNGVKDMLIRLVEDM